MSRSLCYLLTSLPLVPGPVRNISSSVTFFQITISWEKPDRPNGVIIAYEVSYHPTADPQSVTRVNTSDLAISLTVSGLQSGTELTFTVRAYTRVGAGETSAVTAVTYISAREMVIISECVLAVHQMTSALQHQWRMWWPLLSMQRQ